MSQYIEISEGYYAPENVWQYFNNIYAPVLGATKIDNSNLSSIGLSPSAKSFLTKYTPKPVLLYGEPGMGKTSLALHIAKKYNFDVEIITFNESLEADELISSVSVNNSGDLTRIEGKLLKVCTESLKSAQEKGKKLLLILDEISRASISMQSFLIEFLNDTNKYSLNDSVYVLSDKLNPSAGDICVPRKDLFIIATANLGRERETDLVPALEDRFVLVKIGSMPKQFLTQMLVKKGVSPEIAEQLTIVSEFLKIQYEEGAIAKCFSHRKLIDIINTYINYTLSNIANKKSIDPSIVLNEVLNFHLSEILPRDATDSMVEKTRQALSKQIDMLLLDYRKSKQVSSSKVDFKNTSTSEQALSDFAKNMTI